jgi:hypothetical protein
VTHYFASVGDSLSRIVHDVVLLGLADEAVARGRTSGQAHPQREPNNANETENVEDGRPATVEAVHAQESAQRQSDHVTNLSTLSIFFWKDENIQKS